MPNGNGASGQSGRVAETGLLIYVCAYRAADRSKARMHTSMALTPEISCTTHVTKAYRRPSFFFKKKDPYIHVIKELDYYIFTCAKLQK
jgi:hypothetical protein